MQLIAPHKRWWRSLYPGQKQGYATMCGKQVSDMQDDDILYCFNTWGPDALEF